MFSRFASPQIPQNSPKNADPNISSTTTNDDDSYYAPTQPALLPYPYGLILRKFPDHPYNLIRSAVILKMLSIYSHSPAALVQFQAQYMHDDLEENRHLDMQCQALMREWHIPLGAPLRIYEPETIGARLQALINVDRGANVREQERFCLWIFDVEPDNQTISRQPYWCGLGADTDTASRRQPIVLIRQPMSKATPDQPPYYRFLPVQSMMFMFLGRKYCFSCLKPFGCALQHSMECGRKCRGCQRWGSEYPCPAEPMVLLFCPDCKRVFRNRDCYRAHLERVRSPKAGTIGLTTNVCERVRDCEVCKLPYRVRDGPHLRCLRGQNTTTIGRRRLWPRQLAAHDAMNVRLFIERFNAHAQAQARALAASSSSSSSSMPMMPSTSGSAFSGPSTSAGAGIGGGPFHEK